MCTQKGGKNIKMTMTLKKTVFYLTVKSDYKKTVFYMTSRRIYVELQARTYPVYGEQKQGVRSLTKTSTIYCCNIYIERAARFGSMCTSVYVYIYIYLHIYNYIAIQTPENENKYNSLHRNTYTGN